MADEQQKGDVPAVGGGDQAVAQPVEIDLSPLVGKGGGESSVRTEAQHIEIEER